MLRRARKILFSGIGLSVLSLVSLTLSIVSVRNYSVTISKVARQASKPQKVECGVVLTGAPGRVREGIALLSQKIFDKLIISGVHASSTLIEMFPEIVYYPEIKLENVILERSSISTAGNAQYSVVLIEALKCKSVMLITHDYHLYRALRAFEAQMPVSIPLKSYGIQSYKMVQRPRLLGDWRFWGTVVEEWVKFCFYELFVF